VSHELEKDPEGSDRNPTAGASRNFAEATETNHGKSVINYHDPATFEQVMAQTRSCGLNTTSVALFRVQQQNLHKGQEAKA